MLTTMLRSLMELLKPHLVQIPWSTKRRELTINTHLELFECLRSGDVRKVHRCMTEHAGMPRDSLLERLWDTQSAS